MHYYSSFNNALYFLYDDSCINLALENGLDENISPLFENAIKVIFENKDFTASMIKDKPIQELIQASSDVFKNAISIGIKQDIPKELTTALEQNTFRFSGFKTYHQLKEASLLLKNEDGGFKSFEKFKQDILFIDKKYNQQFLEAEYNYAVQSTQMAVNWHEFAKDGDNYNLQYRTAGDEKVRAEHAILNNITLPFSDPFWNQYFPPNGWNCRCTAVQVNKDKYPLSDSQEAIDIGEKATTQIGKNGENKAAIFRFNPGKEMIIFPPKHPYYKAPQDDKAIVEKHLDRYIKNTTILDIKGIDNVKQYASIDIQDSDYKSILLAAEELANIKKSIAVITPKINNPSSLDYQKVYGNLPKKYYGKCPDLKVGDLWYEHEGFTSNNAKSALKNMLSRGLKQSDRIIIEDCGVSEGYIYRNVLARIKEGQSISEVYMIKKDKLLRLYPKAE